MNDDRYAHLYRETPEAIVRAAGFVRSEHSRRRPGKPPSFSLAMGRITGFADLYLKDGELLFGSLDIWYRVREPVGRIARRLDWAYRNGVWVWAEDYRADDVEGELDRDCRSILLAFGQGRVLAGEQGAEFQIVFPFASEHQRIPGIRGEVNRGALSDIDTEGLVDIRDLAFAPFPPAEPRRRGKGKRR